MSNWARWNSGAPIGVAISGTYDLEARGRREYVSSPLLNGEAADVDQAVSSLPRELYDVICVHWLGKKRRGKRMVTVRISTARQRARACGCSERTYQRRLAHGHERIRAIMRAKRTESERRREKYRAEPRNLDKTPQVNR